MISVFSGLAEREIDVLLKAPVLVCILVAGADGTIDKKELKQAVNLTLARAKNQTDLSAFYTLASSDFEDKVRVLLQHYPSSPTSRNAMVEAELRELNEILPRLAPEFRRGYYELLKELARAIAASSGGWLGYSAVAEEEARYIGLEMVNRPE